MTIISMALEIAKNRIPFDGVDSKRIAIVISTKQISNDNPSKIFFIVFLRI